MKNTWKENTHLSCPKNKCAVAMHSRFGGSNKVYVGSIHERNKTYVVVGSWGKADAANLNSLNKGTFKTFGEAVRYLTDLTENKSQRGYVYIDAKTYRGKLTLTEILNKIYTADIVSMKDQETVKTSQANPDLEVTSKFKKINLT